MYRTGKVLQIVSKLEFFRVEFYSNGKDQQLKRKKVKADSVESEKEYQDGSEAISSFEQIAIDFIDSLDLKDPNASFNGFGIPLYRA